MKLSFLRPVAIFAIFVFIWGMVTNFSDIPPYILPSPVDVLNRLTEQYNLIFSHMWITFVEIITGLIIGTLLGMMTACLMIYFASIRKWVLPVLLLSQIIPTFALAPFIILWAGYSILSKIIIVALIIYFSISTSFYDGLKRTDLAWLDMAKTMRGRKWNILWHIQFPAALPHFASGLRIGTAIVPAAALVGEWIGATGGLGYLMLNAYVRVEIDMMFATLFVLIVFSLLLYKSVDLTLRRLISWQDKVL
jgi:putative hydroxymethylpyrimidine transport system permease protein